MAEHARRHGVWFRPLHAAAAEQLALVVHRSGVGIENQDSLSQALFVKRLAGDPENLANLIGKVVGCDGMHLWPVQGLDDFAKCRVVRLARGRGGQQSHAPTGRLWIQVP